MRPDRAVAVKILSRVAYRRAWALRAGGEGHRSALASAHLPLRRWRGDGSL